MAYFNEKEAIQLKRLSRRLTHRLAGSVTAHDFTLVRKLITDGVERGCYNRDKYGINPVIRSLRTALTLAEEIAPDRNMTITILLYNLCKAGKSLSLDDVKRLFGNDIERLVRGMLKVAQLYTKQASVEDDNFHKLLISLAEDLRVVIIMTCAFSARP